MVSEFRMRQDSDILWFARRADRSCDGVRFEFNQRYFGGKKSS
jgi:hypothetical protein